MEEAQSVKKTPVKVLKIIGNVIFYLIILFILLVSIANIREGSSSDSFPNIFGKGFLSVESDSMDGSYSDSFKEGDMIVVNSISESKRQETANDLQIGDIITFNDSNLSTESSSLNTHRVVYLYDSDDDGNIDIIFTMGDKYAENAGLDYTSSTSSFAAVYGDDIESGSLSSVEELIEDENLQEFAPSLIRGTYSFTITNGGSVASFISSWGLLVIVLPLCIFLAFEIFFFVKNLKAFKLAKYEDEHGDEIAAEKEAERNKIKDQLRKEILEEMKNEEEIKKDKSEK